MNKHIAFAAVIGMACVGQAQVVWTEDFDSMSLGSISGQNAWFMGSGSTTITTGGSGNPTPHSGAQMAINQPLSGVADSNAHVPTGWSGRNAGNNILSMTGQLWVSSDTSNLGSAIIQVVGLNSILERMGFVGIANNKFIYGTANDIFFGPTATLDQWNALRVDVDLDTSTSMFYANGSLLGTEAFTSGLALNHWGFSTIALNGDMSKPVFYDSLSVEAVPEPASMLVLGAAGLLAVRRRKSG